jgi:hypothetical protein
MGNAASQAAATMAAKKQMNGALGDAKAGMETTPESAALAKKKAEIEQRDKDNQKEFEQKKADRAANKKKLSAAWAANKQANS